MRMLFIVRPDSLMPVVVVLPPTSIKPARQYFLRLAGAQKPYWAVVTRLTLERTKNKDGIDFARLRPSFIRKLDDEEIDAATLYKNELQPVLDSAPIDITSDDYVSETAPVG